jgi:hypothetical protein
VDDYAASAETEPDATSDDYEVGYKKPPVHSQFKPGQSGNLSGRPKRVRELALEQAFQLVPVTLENGETVEMPAFQAVLHAQRAHALSMTCWRCLGPARLT